MDAVKSVKIINDVFILIIFNICRYARKHLSSGGEELMPDLKSAMALLAFTPTTTCKKYKVSR